MKDPFRPMTSREIRRFEAAIDSARAQAGGTWRALSEELTQKAGRSISYVSVHNWRREKRVPPKWALVLDALYDNCDFMDLCPYLKEVAA